MSEFVSNRPLHLSFVLVDQKHEHVEGASPEIWVSVGGVPLYRVDLEAEELNNGWYKLVVPAKYVGGYDPIIVEAVDKRKGTMVWRDMVPPHVFDVDGGDIFEPDPLPPYTENENKPNPPDPVEPPDPPDPPAEGYGPNLLMDSWRWHDRNTGGSLLSGNQNSVVVQVGHDPDATMQVFNVISVPEDGVYRVTFNVKASNDGQALVNDLIMNNPPYTNLGMDGDQAQPYRHRVVAGSRTQQVDLEHGFQAHNPARFRFFIEKGVTPGTTFTFSNVSLCKKLS